VETESFAVDASRTIIAGALPQRREKLRIGPRIQCYEYVQPHFRKRVFRRETLSCRCGHIVTAPAPDRVGDKTRYAPSFIAHLIVTKCGDSIPQYRLEKASANLGIPMSRSTMCSLLHRGARELRPLQEAATALVPAAPDVHADETSMRQQDVEGRARAPGASVRALADPLRSPALLGSQPPRKLRAPFRNVSSDPIPAQSPSRARLLPVLRNDPPGQQHRRGEPAAHRPGLVEFPLCRPLGRRQNLAALYTLVASCEKNGVNAIAYLTDVLTRVQTHPACRVEELLPHRWKPPDSPG
jgi:transposase